MIIGVKIGILTNENLFCCSQHDLIVYLTITMCMMSKVNGKGITKLTISIDVLRVTVEIHFIQSLHTTQYPWTIVTMRQW